MGDSAREITGGVVVGVLKNLLPNSLTLLPNDDLAIVRCGSENVAEFGMRPGDLPDGTFVTLRTRVSKLREAILEIVGQLPAKSLEQTVVIAGDLEYLDGFVGGASLRRC